MSTRAPGRQTIRTPEIDAEIIRRISEGEPLTQICRTEDFPSPATVRNWQDADESFASAIARARLDGYDAIADEALRIANTPVEGVTTKIDKDGVTETREDMLGHRKLQIETRLKLLAKWDPKRYGEMVKNEHSGPNGGPLKVLTLIPDEADL